jgi:hypothetical protein
MTPVCLRSTGFDEAAADFRLRTCPANRFQAALSRDQRPRKSREARQRETGWRRRRDSNPRYAFGAYNGLANRRLQPLGHVSITVNAYRLAVMSSICEPAQTTYMIGRKTVALIKAVALLGQSMSSSGKPRKSDMSKFIMRAFVVALFVGLVPLSSPARAEIQYPWCVEYGGGRNGIGATSCSFVSREQCMATARGTGAWCVENSAYPGAPSRPVHRHHRHLKRM